MAAGTDRTPRVRCPTCQREVAWSADAPFRPFCSERCRLVDLGAWFSGDRAIPAAAPPDDGADAPGEDVSGPAGR